MEHENDAYPEFLHIMLMANCDPNEMCHGSSPLCAALRTGDARAVELLLQHRADPALCEPGQDDPIFLAIHSESARCARLLLNLRAVVDAQQDYVRVQVPSRVGVGEVMLQQRSTFDAARNCPRILLTLQDAANKV